MYWEGRSGLSQQVVLGFQVHLEWRFCFLFLFNFKHFRKWCFSFFSPVNLITFWNGKYIKGFGIITEFGQRSPFLCVLFRLLSNHSLLLCSSFCGLWRWAEGWFFSSSWAPAWWEWEQVISVFSFRKSCRKHVFTWAAFRRFFTPSWIFCVFKAPLALPCLGLSCLRSAP